MSGTASSTQIGAGQQTPFDSISEASTIIFLARQMIAQMETMIPVSVKTVHAGSGSPPAPGTVDVQLLVSLLDGAGNQVKQGIVYGVPYVRPQGGPWAIVCDPAAGDVGIMITAARDISNLSNGVTQQQIPGSGRQYSYSDGIYVGGVFNKTPAATLWLKPDGTWVLTDKPGNVLQGDSNGVTVTPASGKPFKVNGPIQATGAITAGLGGGDQVSVQTHTHTGVTTGGGTSGAPTPGS